MAVQGGLLWLEQKIVKAGAFGSSSSLPASDNVFVSRGFARQPPLRVRTRLSRSHCPPGFPSPPAGFPSAGVGAVDRSPLQLPLTCLRPGRGLVWALLVPASLFLFVIALFPFCLSPGEPFVLKSTSAAACANFHLL